MESKEEKRIGIIGAGQIGSTTTMSLDEKVQLIEDADLEDKHLIAAMRGQRVYNYTLHNERLLAESKMYPKATQYRRDSPKVHNNDPCTCGSEKKFKKCCKNKLV